MAPYLVPIDPESGYLENWTRRWGRNAGILVTSVADLDTLYAHLRDIFVAKDEDEREYFFRFYDPRVLRSYFTSCTPEERRYLFGPIRAFLLEGANPNELVTLDRYDSKDLMWNEQIT